MRAYVDAEAAGGSQSGDAKVAVPAEKRFWSNRAVVLPGFSLTFKGRAGVGMVSVIVRGLRIVGGVFRFRFARPHLPSASSPVNGGSKSVSPSPSRGGLGWGWCLVRGLRLVGGVFRFRFVRPHLPSASSPVNGGSKSFCSLSFKERVGVRMVVLWSEDYTSSEE